MFRALSEFLKELWQVRPLFLREVGGLLRGRSVSLKGFSDEVPPFGRELYLRQACCAEA